MATSKDYAAEVSLGVTPLDLSGPNASGPLLYGGYPTADFYLAGAADVTSYDLYVREAGTPAPTAANKKGYIETFEMATTVGGEKLIVRGVPLVESQTFYLDGGAGNGTLSYKAYSWGDAV